MMPERFDTDVLIVGGGPAGLAAGIAARQQGFRVTVADCAEPPIDKACGEGLMPDGLEALGQLGVRLNGLGAAMCAFRGIRFVGPHASVAADFPCGSGVGIRRVLLHEILANHAAAMGVELQWRARVAPDGDSIVVNGAHLRSRWLVGADGQNSRVREWAGLSRGSVRARRIALRRHFRVRPWSEYVEIYWGQEGQAYVTPVAADALCVALIARHRFTCFEDGLAGFPELADRLAAAEPMSDARGALSMSRRLRRVWRNRIALVGEASGSVDAITGEGLAMAFRQAQALASALLAGDLSLYAAEHRRISRLPDFMARSMLLMDTSALIRRRTLCALSQNPGLFRKMLAVHVGELPFRTFAAHGLCDLGWRLLTA